MKIIPLSEGAFTVDGSKRFIPFDPSKDDLKSRPRGSLLVEIQPFVVTTNSDVILLDTGLGFTNSDGQLRIHELLLENGIEAADVTKILLSHLHNDHTGGMMMPNKRISAFENATYYVNKGEWEMAMKGSSSYTTNNFKHLCNIEFVEGNGKIGDQIEYMFTGGHSQYHQAFKITDNGEIAFFGGDVASQAQQLKTKYKAKYDFDPTRAMEWREQWKSEAEQEGWKFLFYHDVKQPIRRF